MKILQTTALLILIAWWPLKSWCQPVNDNPCGALVLSAIPGTNCTPTQPLSWTNATATPNLPHPGCASYSTGDVWFTFTLEQTSNVFITTSAGGGGNGITDGGMALYIADDCTSNLVKIDCDDDDGPGNMPQIALGGQGPGQYFIRFWDYYDNTSGAISGICLAVETIIINVPNDNPCDAIELPVQTGIDTCESNTPYSWSGASGTQGIPAPDCGTYLTGDVWFKFTITDTSFVYINSLAGEGPDAIIDGAMALYSATSCSEGFSQINCANNYQGNPMPTMQIPVLLPGEYYIRFWDFSDKINANIGGICVSAEPTDNLVFAPNDDPCGATVLPVSAGLMCQPDNPIVWNLASATANIADPPCANYSNGDIWFSFTLNETSNVYINTTAGTGPGAIVDGAMALYAGNSCTEDLLMAVCDDDSGPGTMPLISHTLSPGVYFIRFWDYYNSISGNIGGICVAANPAQSNVPNDLCFTATPFPVIPADETCISMQANTVGASGQAEGNCGAIADDDVWFSFVVPAGVNKMTFSITAGGQLVEQGIRIYSGECNALTSVACFITSQGLIQNLIPGNTYYLRTYTIPNDDGAVYNICLAAFIPPVNDDPCGALPLNVANGDNCTPNNPQSWQFASASPGLAEPPCGSYTNGDVWFTFSLNATSDIRIKTQAGMGFGAITDGAMMLYFANSCNELTPIICNDDQSPQNYMPEIVQYALIPGTYYIRFWDYEDRLSGNIGGICVAATPSISVVENDICIAATSFPTILTDQSCSTVEVNTELATGTDVPNTYGAEDDDLWYKFTVPPATTKLVYEINTISGNSQQGFYLYEACGETPLVGWYQPQASSGVLYNLVPGQTYYMQVFTVDVNVYSHFTICLKSPPPPPVNDLCQNAISFPVIPEDGSCVGVTVHSKWAENNSYSCSANENGDVWYRFTVPNNTTALVARITEPEGALGLPAFQVLSGDCNNLISLGCYNNSTTSSLRIDGLTPGATYFLRALTVNNPYEQLFDICLGVPPPPPVNDLCPDAIPFPGIPTNGTCATLSINTYGATGNEDDSDCSYSISNDVWYTFTVPDGHNGLLAERSNFEVFNLEAITVYEGDCNNLNPIVCLTQGETWVNGLSGGQTYYLSAAPYFANDTLAFDLCLKTYPNPLPPNDECQTAIAFPPIIPDANWVLVNGNTLGATESGPISCNGYADDDLWYSFVVPAGYSKISFQTIANNSGLVLELFEGSCGNLVSLGCYDDYITAHFSGLISGQTYYLRVHTLEPHDFMTFQIFLRTPPAVTNDDCETAIAFPALPTDGSCISMHGNTTLATGVNDPTCSGNESDDVWYSFIAPDDRTIAVFELTENFGARPLIQLFRGTCNNLQVAECFVGYPDVDDFSNLTPGDRYYIRVYSLNLPYDYEYATDFNLCLSAGPLPPANDNCVDALSIADAPGVFVNPGLQSLGGATVSTQTLCNQFVQAILPFDVWYSFVTDADGGDLSLSAFEAIGGLFLDYQYFNLAMEVLSGQCGNFQSLWCGNAQGILGNDTLVQATLYNLSPNTKYYFRIFGHTQSGGYAPMDFMINAVGSALSPVTAVEEVYTPKNWSIDKVYPSPATDHIFVQYHAPESEIARLLILDMMGRTVLQRDLHSREGENREMIPVQHFPTGMYCAFILVGNKRSEAVRFVKE